MGKATSQDLVFQDGIAAIVGTDNTALVSAICDLAGFDGCTIAIQAGNLTDADMTTLPLLEESEDPAMSGANAVADADLIGTEAGAALIFSSDLKIAKIGYKGLKRYLRLTVTPTGNNSGNIPLSSMFICQNPRQAVNATQIA